MLLIKGCDKDLIHDLIESVLSRDDLSEKVKNYFHRNALSFKENLNV